MLDAEEDPVGGVDHEAEAGPCGGDEPLRRQRPRRFQRPTAPASGSMSRSHAIAMLGITAEQLASMSKRDLTRIYRQKAHELHPDKGGDTELFIRLTAAYEALLPSLPCHSARWSAGWWTKSATT